MANRMMTSSGGLHRETNLGINKISLGDYEWLSKCFFFNPDVIYQLPNISTGNQQFTYIFIRGQQGFRMEGLDFFPFLLLWAKRYLYNSFINLDSCPIEVN